MQQNNSNLKVFLLVIILGGVLLFLVRSLVMVYFTGSASLLSQVDTQSTALAESVEATITARDVQIPITAPTKPASTPTQSETPEPSRTLAPTYTMRAVNTLAGTSGSSEESSEAAYLSRIADLSVGCQQGLHGIAEQSEKASKNTHVMIEAQWKVDLEAALYNVEAYCVGMRDISPVPPRFATLHGYVASMAEEMDIMVDDYRYGVDHLDAESLVSASEHMRKGTEYVEMMGDEMERINNR